MKWLKNIIAQFSIADRWILGAALVLTAFLFSCTEAKAQERWIVVGGGSWLTVSGSPIVFDPSLAWPALLAAKSHHQVIPLNNDNTGFLYNGANLFVQIEAAKALKPTGIIIAADPLDWVTSQSLVNTLANVQKAVVAAKAAGVPVVCLTPHYRTDWRTRRMPLSARGIPLLTDPANPGRAGFAQRVGGTCSVAGAAVIWGSAAVAGLANVGPLTQFTRTVMLPSGHEAMATHVYQQLVNMGLMQVLQ